MITRNFNLYLNAGHSVPLVINVNQFDSGEQWVFTLYNSDGTQYTPSTGAIVGIKSDGLGIINSGSVVDGKVVINETEQMTAAVGKAVFELLIDSQTHGTANFVVLVEEKPGNNADLSESDLSLLQEAIDATSPLPTGGSVGQVLTKTANGSAWSNAGTPTQEQVADAVSDWADEHITVSTGVVIDTSLSVAGAAADAKKTGDEVAYLKNAFNALAEETQIIGGIVWHNGYFDTSQQSIVSNNAFATCEPINGCDGYIYIPSDKLFKCLAYYEGSYRVRTKSNTWLTGGTTVQIPRGSSFIISVKNADSSNVDLSTIGVVVTKRLSALSDEFNHKEFVTGVVNGKYLSAGSTSITPTSHPNYAYIPIEVSRGDKFIISATFSGTNVVGLCLMKNDLISDYYDSSLTTPKFDSELYVCKSDGTLYVCGLVAQDLSVWKLTETNSRRVIDCYGDSLTAGAGDSNIGYPPKLQTLLGSNYTVNQYGSGGDGVNTIACRMGALQMVVPPITIPASGASESFELKDFEGKNVKPFDDGGTHRAYNWSQCPINPCVIDGIAGNIAINQGDSQYTFTRIDAGNAKAVTRPTNVLTPQLVNENNSICVLWGGTNNTWQGVDFIDRYLGYMIEKCKSGRYIVIGLTAKNVFSNIETMNTKMREAFGIHFLDIRQYILDYGLADAGITPTAADTEAIANGEMPPSLLFDATHFNSAGYTVIAKQVFIKGRNLGYWD